MLENKVCVEANATANCAALSYDKQTCMSCDDGFFRNDGFCLECADECLTCSKRENYCLSCANDHFGVETDGGAIGVRAAR